SSDLNCAPSAPWAGASVRPLNFTVRGHERTSRGFAVSGSARPCSQSCAELAPFSRHPSSDTGATAQAVSLGGYGCVLDALHGSHAGRGCAPTQQAGPSTSSLGAYGSSPDCHSGCGAA